MFGSSMNGGAAGFSAAAADKWAVARGISRTPINILLMGQSIMDNPIPFSFKAGYPAVFTSTVKPGLRERRTVPAIGGNLTPMLYDKLWTQLGYDADFANGCVSGMSIFDATGQLGARKVSSAAFGKRTGTNFPDLGDFGELVTGLSGAPGKVFNVTGGSKRGAFAAPPHPSVISGYFTQNIVASDTSALTGASSPDATSVALGGTLTDGACTYTRVNESYYADDGAFYADLSPNGGGPNRNWGGFLGEGSAGRGWDPLGIIANADRLRLQQGPAAKTIVYWEQGQSNLGAPGTSYQKALMLIANYFLRRGCIFVAGTTHYSPGSAGANPTNYQALSDQADAAVTALAAIYPGQVYRGANQYTKFGHTGTAGGQRATGGTGGVSSTTITVSAVVGGTGTGIEVGHKCSVNNGNGTWTFLGRVLSLGTGTGGVGTYVLDTAATVANGTALTFAGDCLQIDGIHEHPSAVDLMTQNIVDTLAAGPLSKTAWAS